MLSSQNLFEFSNFSVVCLQFLFDPKLLSLHMIHCFTHTQSTLDISDCQGANKFVRDIESSTYRVFEISRFDCISKICQYLLLLRYLLILSVSEPTKSMIILTKLLIFCRRQWNHGTTSNKYSLLWKRQFKKF